MTFELWRRKSFKRTLFVAFYVCVFCIMIICSFIITKGKVSATTGDGGMVTLSYSYGQIGSAVAYGSGYGETQSIAEYFYVENSDGEEYIGFCANPHTQAPDNGGVLHAAQLMDTDSDTMKAILLAIYAYTNMDTSSAAYELINEMFPSSIVDTSGDKVFGWIHSVISDYYDVRMNQYGQLVTDNNLYGNATDNMILNAAINKLEDAIRENKPVWEEASQYELYSITQIKEGIGKLQTIFWIERAEYVLNVKGKNIYNNANIAEGDMLPAATGSGWVNATRINLDSARFICWKDTISNLTNGCITNTNSEWSPRVSDFDGSAFTKYHRILTEDHTVYAYYAPKYTLRINAGEGTSVSVEREESPYGNSTGALSNGGTIYRDDKLKICVTIDSGYTFQNYTIQEGSGIPFGVTPNERYCTNSRYYVRDDTTITVSATKNEFYGKSLVSSSNGAWSNSNGESLGVNNTFTQTSGTVTYYIDNCDPIVGCTAKFWHYLKRESGAGATSYSITRESNYESVSSGTVIGKTTVSNFGSDGVLLLHEEAFANKLKPGQVVCETLTFDANSTTTNRTLKVCASALGNAQPPDPNDQDTPEDPDMPSGDKSFLNMKVRNSNVAKYSNYQREVYAKPYDVLNFRSVYNPVLQYTYNLIPERMKINSSSSVYPSSGVNASSLGVLYNNSHSSGLRDWTNAYGVYHESFSSTGTFNQNYLYSAGNTASQTNVNDHAVAASEVGRTLKGNAATNTSTANSTTPSQVEFTRASIGGQDYNMANVITTRITKTATAKIPYNYQTEIKVRSNDEILYAGESGKIDAVIDVLPKTNSETTNGSPEQAYATKTGSSTMMIVVYIPASNTTREGENNYTKGDNGLCARYGGASLCGEKTVLQSQILNSTGDVNGKIGEEKKNLSFNVPDIDAGAEICVAAALYPSNSGSDTNLNAAGSGTWNVSDSKCFKIAKKPSLQVWGGGVFSNYTLKTPVSIKNNLNGYVEYNIGATNRNYIFGSGTELNLISINAVNGFSSGASTGFSHIENGIIWPRYNADNAVEGGVEAELLASYGPGGSFEASPNFCLRSILTFANNNCSGLNGTAGRLGGSGQSDAGKNKEALIERFKNADDVPTIDYERVYGDYIISENVFVDKGRTRVIDVEGGNAIIGHNIEFLNSTTYDSISEIPKLVIFAKNIKINCAVTQIDAVLIADGDVDTCYDSDDINDRAHSNQLIINGSIITNTLSANRTYGAAKGANSIIPAEIINYDATLYLWGSSRADATGSGGLDAAYIHELAPRY